MKTKMSAKKFLNPIFAKAYLQKDSDADTENGILGEAIISTGTVDRDGDVLEASGWDFSNFKNNPVMLWSHNSGLGEQRPAIGKVLKYWVEGNVVKFVPQFDMDDPFARMIFNKFKKGILNAFSIGFMPLEWMENETGYKFMKMEALEFSAVNVPANPEALVTLRSQGISAVKSWDQWKKQMHTEQEEDEEDEEVDTAPEDTEFDQEQATKTLLEYDGALPEYVFAYKKEGSAPLLPIANIIDGHPKVVWNGVKLAMAQLLGAKGGVEIPKEDRRSVYEKLSSHYALFNRQSPSFKHADIAIFKVAEGKKIEEKEIEDVTRAVRLKKKTLLVKALNKLASE